MSEATVVYLNGLLCEEVVAVPTWLYQSLHDYNGYPTLPSPSWDSELQIEYDIMLALLKDIHTEEDFDVLITAFQECSVIAIVEEKITPIIKALHERVSEVFSQKMQEKIEKTRLQEKELMCVLCLKKQKASGSDVCLSCRKEYWEEERRIKIHRYRARKAGTPATLTLGEWVTTLREYNFRCVYCDEGVFEVLEHFMPVSSGGGTTKENCLPSCRSCNSKKHDHTPSA